MKTTDLYTQEAQRRWGTTDAYREFEQRNIPPEVLVPAGNALMNIFKDFGKIKHTSPAGSEAQHLVEKLQAYITDNFYTCTKPMLQGLGQIYIAGDSMTENIDNTGGQGTAAFVHQAITYYCK